MIYFAFNFTNPFLNRFDVCYENSIKVSKNKTLEIEIIKDNTFLSFYFRWAIRESHAGICFDFGLMGYSIELDFHDDRHWDMEKGTWEEIE